MKKTLTLLLAFLLCLAAAPTVSAEDYDYEYHLVNDVGMVVPMPVGYDVFSREMTDDDPIFEKYGTDPETIMNILESNSIYLDGVTPEREIVFSCSDSLYEDLYGMDDNDIKVISDDFKAQLESAGATVTSSEIVSSFTDSFIFFELTDAADCSTYTYITVKNGADMAFTLKSLDGTVLTTEDRETLEFIATNSYSADAEELPEGFDFTENKTGLFFSVPEGWYSFTAAEYKEEFGLEPYFDLLLYRYPTGSSSVYFSVEDLWEETDRSQRSKYGSRSRMSDDSLDKELIAETISVSADKLQSVKYNGINYLSCKNAYDSTDVENVSNFLCTVRNGYLYTFIHDGYVEPDEDILEKLATTAVYPSFEVETVPETKPATEPATERETEKDTPVTESEKTPEKPSSTGKTKSDRKKDTDNKLYVIISASVAALAILAIILILVFKKRSAKKAPQTPQGQGQVYPQQGGTAPMQNFVPPYAGGSRQQPNYQQQAYQQPTYQQSDNPQQQAYQQPVEPQAPSVPVCPGCGNPIPPTGKFCPVCGSKIRD